MITEFLEGENYRNPSMAQDIFVLGIHSETSAEVTMAILWIDRDTIESSKSDILVVKKSDFGNWSQVEYD